MKSDKIRIVDLEIYTNHGVLAEEKVLGQKFIVSCEMDVDIRRAGNSDSIDDSVNYAVIADLINDVMKQNTFNLIETCVETISRSILNIDDRISSVWVEVKKPWAPIGLPLDTVSVSCKRCRHDVFIGLGSNIGDSKGLIESAIEKLSDVDGTKVVKVSTLIETEPYGYTDQPNFVNGVVRISTLLTPHELLDELHRIEAEAGRERLIRWGPRTLDLDILLYDDLILEDDDLCIPHVDMANRDFVLKPMKEIAPYKVHPILRKRMVEL